MVQQLTKLGNLRRRALHQIKMLVSSLARTVLVSVLEMLARQGLKRLADILKTLHSAGPPHA